MTFCSQVIGPLCLGLGITEAETGKHCSIVFFPPQDGACFINVQSYLILFLTEAKILCEAGAEVKENIAEEGQDCDQLTFFPVLNETPAVTEPPTDLSTSCTSCSHSQDCSYIRIILQELQTGDEVL